jgi:hypothetical protein
MELKVAILPDLTGLSESTLLILMELKDNFNINPLKPALLFS